MGIKFEDLNPCESSIKIDNKEFKLRKFDLIAQVWALNYFSTKENKDGMLVLAERLRNNNDAEAILTVAWHLLKRKTYFTDYETFVEKIDNSGGWIKIMEILLAVVETLGVSQPQLAEFQEDLELKKSLAAEA